MSESAAEPEGGNAERWSAPAIDGSDGPGLMTAEKLEALQREAWDEAWQSGHAEGLEAGRQEMQAAAAGLTSIADALAAPLAKTDEAVVEQLVELAALVVRKLFQREIDINPGHVVGVVREAIALLPIAARDVRVQLHPDDARLVRDALSSADGEQSWSIVEDPLVSRGGCRVITATSRIDATAESRLKTVLAKLLGERREEGA